MAWDMRVNVVLRLLLFLWLYFFGAGCGPKITQFTVEPRSICYGDTIRADWDVTGTPSLLITMVDSVMTYDEPNDFRPRLLGLTLMVDNASAPEDIGLFEDSKSPPNWSSR